MISAEVSKTTGFFLKFFLPNCSLTTCQKSPPLQSWAAKWETNDLIAICIIYNLNNNNSYTFLSLGFIYIWKNWANSISLLVTTFLPESILMVGPRSKELFFCPKIFAAVWYIFSQTNVLIKSRSNSLKVTSNNLIHKKLPK